MITRKFTAVLLICSFALVQVVQPVRAWFFLVPLATRLLPYSAGLITRGTTWLAGTVGGNATVLRIGETVTAGVAGAIYLSYLMSGESTSPATTGRIRAQIALKPNDKRDNPDPAKWNDATTTVDPTPKVTLPSSSSFPLSGVALSTWSSLRPLIPLGEKKLFQSADGARPHLFWRIGYSNSANPQHINDAAVSISNPSLTAYPGYTGFFWSRSDNYLNPSTGQYEAGYYARGVASTGFARDLTWADVGGCSAGYTLDAAGQCALTDQSLVMKPDMPCEVVEVNGAWQIDTKNPSCIGANNSAFTTTGGSARLNYSDGTSTTVTRNSDGGLTIEDANPTQGTTRVVTGPYNASQNGYPVQRVSQSAPGTDGSGSMGSCGGPGQTPCAVTLDTSGFEGRDAQVNQAAQGAQNALDARKSAFESLVSSQQAGDHGINATGLFNLNMPQVQCQPIGFQFINATVQLDVCEGSPAGQFFSMFRIVLAMLLSVSAGWYLWRRFTTGTVNSGS